MMESAGGIIFANLPLLFAVGAAIGLVGGDGVASRGVDKANYPITRKFLFGVQLDF